MTSNPRILPEIPLDRWRWISSLRQTTGEEIVHSCHEQWMRKNQHEHSHREIMMALEGDYFYGTRGRIYQARPGNIFLFDRNEPHDEGYSPFQPALRSLWLFFSSSKQALVSEFMLRPRESGSQGGEANRGVFLRRAVISGAFVEGVVQRWDACARMPQSEKAFDALKVSILALLYHAEPFVDAPASDLRQKEEQQRIVEYVQDHVRQHPGGDLSVETLARLAGYAPTYFHRLFKNSTGERLHVFVNSVRLAHAKRLLADGHTVESVAERSGFGTAAYFSRFFKQATGIPPSHWRG